MSYSGLDRTLHRFAFGMPGLQQTAASIEDAMFRARLQQVEARPPVFVTSLPRAGTTVLLEALSKLPGFATHTYRDMPFVMAPLLWSRLNGGFRRSGALQERAHGDGVRIGYDSPEAFEEIIWREFWPHKYRQRITLWHPDDMDCEAREFFERHFAKLIALRCENSSGARYLSKNNANIARLNLLPVMFPGAKLVVPLRDPFTHAMSLARQHRNFLVQQSEEPFVRRYMADIGHFEFGLLHRPIEFEGLEDAVQGRSPDVPDYWLAYWLAAFGHVYSCVRAHGDALLLVAHEAIVENPRAQLGALLARLGLSVDADASAEVRQSLDAAAAQYRAPGTAKAVRRDVFDQQLSDRALALHAALLEHAELPRSDPFRIKRPLPAR